MWVVELPISIKVSKKKSFSLNLNQYRNAHHHTLSKAKVNFHEHITPLIAHLPRMEAVNLVYSLFVGTMQSCDTNNVCSIVDKFFSDCLVTEGVIEDDNYSVVLSSLFRFGGFDKGRSRVEVSIEPVGSTWPRLKPDNLKLEGNDPVKIIIVQAEIEAAIIKDILSQMSINDDQELSVDLSATRGTEGFTAEINVRPKTAVTMPSRKPAAAGKTTVSKAPTTVAATPAATVTAAPTASVGDAEAEVEQPAEEQIDEGSIAEQAEAAPAPAAPSKSIFGNMQRPVNTPAAG